ncbi:myb/SANT-like DNA-binding domain-containing protein 3 [Monomorium pharaonis]|uniref:myb/SANT-like DNA-binding domain-containing protein 3 n=1 Tax=Monomorium pharaonis TaxID=307658 RepID=UPI001747C351|nr:myb/SANT-like DNA-binding domain-containing protein 3 [Monomorium pharaonis]XP_036150454.1 myb/SANT-like DNA-binding domain-containing protein 3 [Monomorium pharaonis]
MSSSISISVKRKRDPTFQPAEKNNLIDIVSKHYNIVECKKTDALSTRAKNEEWMKIASEFNASSTFIDRESQVLKNLWENLKKKAKFVMTQQNQSIFATGGGPPKKFKEDPTLERVITLIRPNVQGFMNTFDNDGPTISVSKENDEDTDITHDEVENIPEDTLNGDWSTYTPSMLKTPRASVLRQNQDLNIINIPIEYVADSEDILKENTQVPCSTSSANSTEITSCSTVSTPTIKSKKYSTSRRRPILKQSEGDVLAHTKIKTLIASNEQATEQHEITLRILALQEKQEQEKLKQGIEKTEQEKLRTEMLREEMQKMKKH